MQLLRILIDILTFRPDGTIIFKDFEIGGLESEKSKTARRHAGLCGRAVRIGCYPCRRADCPCRLQYCGESGQKVFKPQFQLVLHSARVRYRSRQYLSDASPAGRITLGQPGEKPEYSTASWVAMLFSAGMGIGLVFYGAALPLTYYAKESPMAKPGTEEALSQAFQWTYYQQGIHAWAIYGIVALALAYFQFRKKDNALISSTLRPLLGQKVDGGIGRVIDVFTIIATVTGVATTLGFGAAQINSGLNSVFGVREKLSTQFIIIAVCTVAFLISATTGLQKASRFCPTATCFSPLPFSFWRFSSVQRQRF